MPQRKGRPNLGKSKTIKERSVYLYVPTEGMVEQWKKEARRHGMPLSRFLVEIIDDAMRRNPSGLTPKEELEKELAKASSELASLRSEKESFQSLLRQTEASVASYRESLYTLAEHTHDEAMLSNLIGLFKKRRVRRVEEVPAALGIDATDEAAMSRLQDGIGYLKKLGLIEGDFDELRCTIGKRKMLKVPPEIRKKQRAMQVRSISRRLQAARHDAEYGSIIRIEPP